MAASVVAEDDDEPAPARHPVQIEVAFVAVLFMLVTLFFGIFPSPLFDVASDAGAALTGLF